MASILITGGTGMIGRLLTKILIEKGYEVIVLSRNRMTNNGQQSALTFAHWDIENQLVDADAIQKADHIIHLAGAGVADKRWNLKRKKEIVDSRIQSSVLLVKALTEIPNKIKSIISASAIGWYGPDTKASIETGFAEDAVADTAFLGETCRLWEESIQPVEALHKRLVKLRVGIVLSNDGGAFVEFKKPLKSGLATILGNGEQVVSWIHIEDLCRLYICALEHEDMHGVYNAVAPYPVTNRQLIIKLAKKMRGKFYIPVYVPSFVLKIAMGEMSVEILKSATVSSKKAKATGFDFLYPTIDAALENLAIK
jgi:hypothetical protein